MMWLLFLVLLVTSFVLGMRYERQRQHQLKTDYFHGLGFMWNLRPQSGESLDDFRVRILHAMKECPDATSRTEPF